MLVENRSLMIKRLCGKGDRERGRGGGRDGGEGEEAGKRILTKWRKFLLHFIQLVIFRRPDFF